MWPLLWSKTKSPPLRSPIGKAMDFATRLKVLSRMAKSSSPSAEKLIAHEQGLALNALKTSDGYDQLSEALEVMALLAFRASAEAAPVLDEFIRTVDTRELRYSSEYAELIAQVRTYRNASALICKAIDVLVGLRYLQTAIVTHSLLWASSHPNETVRRAAITALKKVGQYNFEVFAGTQTHGGIGARPQLEVLGALNEMGDASVLEHLEGSLALVTAMLSTSMERTFWSSSRELTIVRGATPPTDDVATVRSKCLELLDRLYRLSSDQGAKRSIISAMSSAARPGRAVALDPEYAAMISTNAQAVLGFYREAISSAELHTIQKIEHSSYWIFRNTLDPFVRAAALEVKAAIETNSEYTVYKTLVGFEGVFGDWDAADPSLLRGEASQDARTAKASEFVREITPESSEQWRGRILRFASTQSNDLATFPVFFKFLEDVARAHPKLALTLLTDDISTIANFAIPLLRGLWDGSAHEEARALVTSWISSATIEDEQLLRATAKMFLSSNAVDFDVLDAILSKAIELHAKDVVDQILTVAVARYSNSDQAERLKALFLHCIKVLTEYKDASWVHSVWYREEAKGLVSGLDHAQRVSVLENLRMLPSIDYQAEDVLTAFAEVAPAEVIRFFCMRAEDEARLEVKRPLGDFEAIPLNFHSLHEPLSRHPREAVSILLENYRASPSLFEFRGGKLLQDIFPKFGEAVERELLALVGSGADKALDFVVSVLRAYDGEAFLYPVCKAVVEHLPVEHPVLQSVSAVLLSTGVVMGEFGMAEAYEKKLNDLSPWLDDNSENVRVFARSFLDGLKSMIEQERQRAEEYIALRKFQFGEK